MRNREKTKLAEALIIAIFLVGVIVTLILTNGNKWWLRQAQPDTLKDTILFYREKRIMHADSAHYYDSLSTIANEKYINYRLAGVATLDSIRAEYRSRLRDTLRKELVRQRNSLRAAETSSL